MSNKAIQEQLKQVSDFDLRTLVELMDKYLQGSWTEGYENFHKAYQLAGNPLNGSGHHFGETLDQSKLERLKLETNKVPVVENGWLKFVTIEQMEIATKKIRQDISRSMGIPVRP